MSMSARCERTDDARELRLSLLTELRRAVPFSWFAWLLTDPSTEVGVAPIADCPCLPDLPRLIRLKYATEVNRWTRLPGPVARLHAATDGRLDRSLLWRRLLVDHGVTDVASIGAMMNADAYVASGAGGSSNCGAATVPTPTTRPGSWWSRWMT